MNAKVLVGAGPVCIQEARRLKRPDARTSDRASWVTRSMHDQGVELVNDIDESVIRRFNEKWVEDENGCWIWQAYTNKDGYGVLGVANESRRAHRVSYAIHNDGIPEGKLVNHHCDVEPCVNPDHLYAGTNSDNLKDAAERGDLDNSGENNANAKLTPEEVEEIRERYTGEYGNATALGREYGVSHNQIIRIGTGEQWSEEQS